jgi:2-polyprenyl-3-methyl-5-hydroxy-6-metoxy-1,4-benzoquinol methylase
MESDYYKNLDKVYSWQFRNSIKKLPLGQINFHKKNFLRYFDEDINSFKKLQILETGAGPGVHAIILSLMGANVTASDILESNIKKIKRLKKIYRLHNLHVQQHDFRKKFKDIRAYNIISCHNWIQHSPNPSLILKNLVRYSKINTKIYISCYHSKTFRFFITQIARKILKPNDFKLIKKRIRFFFPKGFKIYNNQDNIYASNITDDFFSPYVVTTDYENLALLANEYGLKIYRKKLKIISKNGLGKEISIPLVKNLYHFDDANLKVGVKKVRKSNCINKRKIYSKPYDEFKTTDIAVINECVRLSKKIIKKFKKKIFKTFRKSRFLFISL